MYFTEWRKSESIQCLQHIRDVPFITEQLKRLRNAQPTIKWVVTHRATKRYEYHECQDRSVRVEDLGPEQHSLITLRITNAWDFGNEVTETHLNETKREFESRNKKDKHQSFTQKSSLNEDFDVHSLVESPGRRSKFVSFV